MNAWIWNGAAFEPGTDVSVQDRGFRYGMALFESLRVLHGAPLFFEPHLLRLRDACRARHFPVDERALTAAGEILRGGPDGFARIYVTGGDGSAAAPVTSCRVVVMLEERDRGDCSIARLAIWPEVHRPLFGGLKTANYWVQLEALRDAHSRGCDEALLFNENAELISAAMGNVFLVQGGVIRTPALPCGVRDGVIRAWVLAQEAVQERSLFVHDVQSAEEIFVTNSWRGIASVSEVEGRPLPVAQPLAERLSTAYERHIVSAKP